jgi:MarR family transcriptional regulator, 2-MHQ and catechol-resistance regulon repressor
MLSSQHPAANRLHPDRAAMPALPAAATHPDAAEFRRAIRELTRLHLLRDRARVSAAGVTVAGAHALEVLAEQGALSLTALSAELFVDRSTACRIVGLLEDHGYVERLPDPTDGRAIRVQLSATGLALEAALRQDAVRETSDALADFPPETRGEALRFLRRLTRTSARHAGASAACTLQEDE